MPLAAKAVAVALPVLLCAAYAAYDSMSISALRAKHAGAAFPAKRALVVGGTSGIGMGIARRLAMAQVDVTIVGRSAESGAQVLVQLRAAGGRHHAFIQCDVEKLSNVKGVAREWRSSFPGSALDVLVLTQGLGSLAGRTETADGLERKLALHHYSRQAFIEELLPELRSSGQQRTEPGGVEPAWPGARVLSVLAAGAHGPYAHYATDPDLVTHFSLKNAADAACLYNDVCLDARSREPGNANVTFIHAAPGVVSTQWGRDMPAPIRWVVQGLMAFGDSPLDCAEAMLHLVFDCSVNGGFFPISSRAVRVSVTSAHEKALPVVYAHTQDVLRRLM